jgi:predicted transcriptional regulator
VLTVRLPQDDADRVEFIARVQNRSVNDVIRQALESYVSELRADADFVGRAKSLLARDTEIASQLV